MSLFANVIPNAEDAARFAVVAATYGEDVIDALIWAYGIGCIRGNAQGEKFGIDMIASLREDGAFR